MTQSGPFVRFALMSHADGLPAPEPASIGAAGVDLLAALPATAPLRLAAGGRALVPTGLRLQLPPGFEAQLRPRSGLALRHGVTVLNAPGTIDGDYRGEIKVVLVNLGDLAYKISRGDRIAQLVIAPVVRLPWLEAQGDLETTDRGTGGFGSTGGMGS